MEPSLEAWESIYRAMLKCYIKCEDTETMTMPGRLLEDIGSYLQSLSASDLRIPRI